jgi:hypothetical protein
MEIMVMRKYVFLLVLLSFGKICWGDDVLKKRFLAEYPLAVKEWESKLSRCSGKFRTELQSKLASKEFGFERDHGMEKIHGKSVVNFQGKELREEDIHCFGNKSYFKLYKPGGAERFRINSDGSDQMDIAEYQNGVGRYFMVPLTIRPAYLVNMLKAPTFHLLGVSASKENSNLVTIRYSLGEPDNLEIVETVLDTSNHWAMVSQFQFPQKNPVDKEGMVVEYGKFTDGFAMPRAVRFLRNGKFAGLYSFDEWKFDPIPEKNFTLEAYGIRNVSLDRAR